VHFVFNNCSSDAVLTHVNRSRQFSADNFGSRSTQICEAADGLDESWRWPVL